MPIQTSTEEQSLKIKILSQKSNPLLKRKEIVFEVEHSQEGQTSSRLETRKSLANILKTKFDLVFVEKMETKTGTMTAMGEANAYDNLEQAKLVECEHIINRNMPPEKPEGTEKPRANEEREEKKPTKEEEVEEEKGVPEPRETQKEEKEVG